MARARRGTRPGDPLADLIYGFAMAKCRRRLHDRLREEGLLEAVPWNGRRDFDRDGDGQARLEVTDVLYADDDAFLLVAPAEDILNKMRVCAGLVHDAYLAYGLLLNFSEGKTEFVVKYAGPGSREAKVQLVHGHAGLAHARSRLSGAVRVRVVHSYRHLGTLFAGQWEPEH